MYLMQIDEFVFPITPSKITQTMKSNNETVTLINEGEVLSLIHISEPTRP